MPQAKGFRTFGEFWVFSSAANTLAYRVKTLKGEAFLAALCIVSKNMPQIPSRKPTDKLNEGQIESVSNLLALGIGLGILPVKTPATKEEYDILLRKIKTSGCDAGDWFVTHALWSRLSHWYDHGPGLLDLIKLERAKKPLGEIREDLPQCLEVAIRSWVEHGTLDPFEVLDLETIYK